MHLNLLQATTKAIVLTDYMSSDHSSCGEADPDEWKEKYGPTACIELPLRYTSTSEFHNVNEHCEVQ